MHPTIFTELARPITGAAISAISGSACYVAQIADAIPPDAKSWIEGGGTLGFIGGLSFAVVTLWKDNKELRGSAEALNKQMRDDWKAMNERMAGAIEKLEDAILKKKGNE